MTHIKEFSNGLKLVHQDANRRVAHCCVLIKVGTRDENNGEEGFAHFTEHALFKGTKHRKTYHILNRLDEVGGELNAYTTKEYTCIHASFLHEYYERAIELFYDVLFHSSFPAKEIDREKEVILDELMGYEDNPTEAIFDEFDEVIFPNHELGRNILGTKESIQQANSHSLLAFVAKHYHPNRMIISSSGNIPIAKIENLVNKYFGNIDSKSLELNRQAPELSSLPSIIKPRPISQNHCILGWRGYPVNHPKGHTLDLISNYLGGNSLNAKLYVEIREKKGLAYNIESSLTSFSDSAMFNIYYATEPKNNEKIVQLIHKEIHRLKNHAFGTNQLAKIKRQIEGQLTISLDYQESLMNHNGKELLYADTIEPVDEIFERIRNLKSIDIMDVANEIFNSNAMALLSYVPSEKE